MPAPTFLTRNGGTLLIADAALGEVVELDELIPSTTDVGWDSATAAYLMLRDAGHSIAELIDEALPQFYRYPDSDFWITGTRPTCIGPNLYRIDCTFKGRSVDKGWRFKIRTHEDIQNAENIEISSVVYDRVSVSEIAPEVEAVRVVIGQRPAVNLVGTVLSPSLNEALTVRTSGWTSLADFTYHYPNGWVLASQEIEEFIPSDSDPATDGAFLERHVYQYRYAQTP